MSDGILISRPRENLRRKEFAASAFQGVWNRGDTKTVQRNCHLSGTSFQLRAAGDELMLFITAPYALLFAAAAITAGDRHSSFKFHRKQTECVARWYCLPRRLDGWSRVDSFRDYGRWAMFWLGWVVSVDYRHTAQDTWMFT